MGQVYAFCSIELNQDQKYMEPNSSDVNYIVFLIENAFFSIFSFSFSVAIVVL